MNILLHQRCVGVATIGARLGVAKAKTRPSEQRAPKRSDPEGDAQKTPKDNTTSNILERIHLYHK